MITEQDYRTFVHICGRALNEQQRRELNSFLTTHSKSLLELDINDRQVMIQNFIKGMLNLNI